MKGLFLTFIISMICFSSTKASSRKKAIASWIVACPSKQNVEIRKSWLSKQKHGSSPSKNATVDQRLKCKKDQLGHWLVTKLQKKRKALPKNCKLDNNMYVLYHTVMYCIMSYCMPYSYAIPAA